MKYRKGEFTVIPNITHLKALSSGAQALFVWFCHYSNEEGTCFPSRTTLSNNLNCSIRTIDQYTKELVSKGFIKKYSRISGNEKLSNLYQILLIDDSSSAELAQPEVQIRTTSSVESAHRTISNRTISTQLDEQSSSEEFLVVKDEEVEPRKPKKFDPTVVFKLFRGGKFPLNWKTNVTERQAAENLYNERGVEQIVKALTFIAENHSHPFCPKIHKPSDLDRKWSNLIDFKKKEYGD